MLPQISIAMLKRWGFLASICCWLSCVSAPKPTDEPSKEAKIRSTQRAIVVNYLNKGLPSRALKELRPLLAETPDDADLLSLMGLTQLALGSPESAVDYLERAYKMSATPTTALNLSSAYIESGSYEKAASTLLDLRSQKKQWSSYAFPERLYHNLGLAAERRNKPKSAEKFYGQALKHNPNFYLSVLQLGSLYSNSKRYKRAQKQFQKALSICPTCFDPMRSLAELLVKQKKAKSATQLLVKFSKRRDVDANSRQQALALARSIQPQAR